MITDPIQNLAASIAHTRARYGVSNEAAEFLRRRGPDKIIEPTADDWRAYHAALTAIDAANASPHIWIDADIDEPKPQREPGDYIESEREWIERVVKLFFGTTGKLPDDLDRALTVHEFKTIYNALRAHEQNGYGA